MTGLSKKVFVIFGGTGDLTFNKLLPAFYDLVALDQLESDSLQIVLIGRRDYNNELVHERMLPFLQKQTRFNLQGEKALEKFKAMVSYYRMDFMSTDDYFGLRDYLKQFGREYLFYLATAPDQFGVIASSLEYSGIIQDAKSKQLLIEKPFGENLASAKKIDFELKAVFNEDEIYRIDHYLAKEMMMNILTIRFSNQVFKRLWDRKSVESVQITAFEEHGINDRGGYYDKAGAMQDMFQSHLLQIVSYLLMSEPESMSVADIHAVQQEALASVKVPGLKKFRESFVMGQYEGYRLENKVNPESKTETYMALTLKSSLPQWKGVPIYVRTGKYMSKQSTYVAITFKPLLGLDGEVKEQNVLIIRIGPDEGIYFKVNIKKPGHFKTTQSIWMDFCQSCIFENRLNTPKAYERLLLMALNKDQTLFASWEMVQTCWAITEKVSQRAAEQNVEVLAYEKHTLGPSAADDMVSASGHQWVDEQVYGEQQS